MEQKHQRSSERVWGLGGRREVGLRKVGGSKGMREHGKAMTGELRVEAVPGERDERGAIDLVGFCCALERKAPQLGHGSPWSTCVGFTPRGATPKQFWWEFCCGLEPPGHRSVLSVTPNASVVAGFAGWPQEVGGIQPFHVEKVHPLGGSEQLPEDSTPRCYVPNSSPGT